MNINHLNLSKISDGLLELAKPKITFLKSICKNTKNSFSLISNSLPKKGGIYVFWWTGDKNLFITKINRELDIPGPSKRNVKIHINDEWLNSFDDNICL
ncbi:MAG: hypothetical protein ACOYMA_13780 [Bacteroidia bacterium]